MIAKILKHFRIGVSNLRYISLSQTQEFNKSTMTNMSYHWDNVNKVYFYQMKGFGKIIYNYDDSNEFVTINVEEKLVDDQDHHMDAKMADIIHVEDEAWLHDETYRQNEDPQGLNQ